jgi:hypothetical protein
MERPGGHAPFQQQEYSRARRITNRFGKLVRRLPMMSRGETVSDSQDTDRDQVQGYDFDLPPASRAFGPVALDPIVMDQNPSGPSSTEIEDRALIREAMAIEHPWKGDLPPLYSSSRADKK